MDVAVMEECTRASHEERITFGEVVGRLIAAGVERYHADLVRGETTYFMPDGQSHRVTDKTVETRPASAFSADGVLAAVRAIQAGKIKAFAVTAKQRLKAMPDIPTVDEAGLPGLYIEVWHGLWAPKGTPKEVTAKLSAAILEALTDPQVREKFAALGQDIPPPAQQTAEALRAHHKAEIELWWPLIKAAGIKIE